MLGAAPRDARPWMNPVARRQTGAPTWCLPEMTRDEKLTLVFGYFATDFPPKHSPRRPKGGPARPAMSPASRGSAFRRNGRRMPASASPPRAALPEKRERTALPSGLATGRLLESRTSPFRAGAMIGAEARASGFNVMLAGGVNLMREPRNGRNFEYGGEDPLLAGTMVGAQIAGIQSNHIISTIKHYALNDQETGRDWLNVTVDPDAARMSDLLAFQFAIERGDPGSVMCSYNRVSGEHACENPFLLNQVLRRDWNLPGYVMSDWGATHSTAHAANAGLDQDSGFPFDDPALFPRAAERRRRQRPGPRSAARRDGAPHPALDVRARAGRPSGRAGPDRLCRPRRGDPRRRRSRARCCSRTTVTSCRCRRPVRSIAVIGGHADKGVLSGGGSSLVYPVGGNAVPGIAPTGWPGPVVYYPSSPMAAIRAQAPRANVRFAGGDDPAAAARLARDSDVVIVFAHQWTCESIDTSLTLPDRQDALIAAVAAANPRTVVVLETGGPVLMPWLDQVAGVLEVWYPGHGAAATRSPICCSAGSIRRASLPISFPRDESQLPRPRSTASATMPQQPIEVNYSEGAAVGYRWYEARGLKPLFPFGHGLSYTSFGYGGLSGQRCAAAS